MFMDNLFISLNYWKSLHLNPLAKSNPLMFNWIKYCLYSETLLRWLLLQGCNLASTDQIKHYSSLFSKFKIEFGLKGVLI